LRRLPVPAASGIGAGLGHLYVLQGDLRGQLWIKRARRNVRQIIGKTDERTVNRIVYDAVRNAGRHNAEIPVLTESTRRRTRYRGLENLKSIDGPTILLFPHLSNWELASLPFLDTGRALTAIYTPPESEVVHRAIVDARLCNMQVRAPGSKLIPATATAARDLVRAAKAGENLLIAIDEERDGLIWAPAFGRLLPPAGNRFIAARLARRFGHRLVPVSVRRQPDVTFDVTVHEPIEVPQTNDASADIETAADRIAEFFETLIRDNLDQWYWLAELRLDRPFPKR